MEVSRTAVGALAAICVAAGAGGAYVATRGGESIPQDGAESAAVLSLDAAPAAVAEPAPIVTEPPAATPAPPPRPVAPRPAARAPRPAPPPPVADVAEREEAPVLLPRASAETIPAAIEPVRTLEPEPTYVPQPPEPQFEELYIAADSVVGLQLESSHTSEEAQVEDEVVARVTRDVRVGDRVAIPAGARAVGEITLVERGGRLRERARLGIRFTSVVFADGTRVPLQTETIFREGDSPSGESAAKIGGGAIGGAIIGGILGGAKGAVIGGSAGAGAGSAAVLAGGRNPATLPAGTPVTVRLIRPTTVTVER